MEMQKYEKKLYLCKKEYRAMNNATRTDAVGRFMRRTPMLRVVLGMAVGIVLEESGVAMPIWLAGALAVMAVGVMVWHVVRKQRGNRVWFVASLWVVFVLTGWAAAAGWQHNSQCVVAPTEGKQEAVVMTVRVKDTPRGTARYYKMPVEVEAVEQEGEWREGGGRLMLYLHKDSMAAALNYDDRIVVRGRLGDFSGEENPYQFNYRQYMRRKGLNCQCFVERGCWTAANGDMGTGTSIVRWSKIWQRRLVERLQQTALTSRQQGVAEALMLGWRDDLDDATQQQFRDAGVMHLLCVSGLHVGIVAWLAGCCMFFLGRRRWHRVVKGLFQIVVIAAFVLMTGMAPSTVRAGVMLTLLLLSDMIEQRPNSFNNLCTSALLLLGGNPMVLYDMGFQLSYAAVAGILLWSRPLKGLLPLTGEGVWRWMGRKVCGYVCLTMAAQLATLPLVLYHFHQFPTWFMIANLMLVPFAGVLLATVMAVLVTGWGWMTTLLQGELDCVDMITRWVGTLPGAVIENIYCDGCIVLLTVLLLVMVTVLLIQRRLWPLLAMVCVWVLMAIYMMVVDWRAERQDGVVVYSAGKHLALECISGRQSWLVCDSETADNVAAVDYERKGFVTRRRIKHTEVVAIDSLYNDGSCAVVNHCIVFDNKKIWVIEKKHNPFPRYGKGGTGMKDSMCFDAVIVAPGTKVDVERLKQGVCADTVLYRYGFTMI